MKFGYHHMSFEYPDETDRSMIEATVERARWLDREGFSLFTLMDHMWQLTGNGQREGPFLDCYTTLPAVARETQTIELSALVTCPHYRNPAYLARIIASLDHISEQRITLGIGAGWYRDEYEAMDITYPDIATRNRQMREVIELCQRLWYEDSPVSYTGDHYEVEEFYCEPSPGRDIPVLVGGSGEQLTLRAVAEYADRWNMASGDPETFEGKVQVLRDHCETAGRDCEEIEKTLANTTIIREDESEAHRVYERRQRETENGPVSRDEYRGAVGTPARVRELLSDFESAGVDTFLLKVPSNDRRTVELFVDEVMPAF